jgi:hypothetical protein
MWCRSSPSGRADALYVVNDALGSFLLRASEVIAQVPMSACGTFQTSRSGRAMSAYECNADIGRPLQVELMFHNIRLANDCCSWYAKQTFVDPLSTPAWFASSISLYLNEVLPYPLPV